MSVQREKQMSNNTKHGWHRCMPGIMWPSCIFGRHDKRRILHQTSKQPLPQNVPIECTASNVPIEFRIDPLASLLSPIANT